MVPMRFSVIGRDVEFGWRHLGLAAGWLAIFAILLTVVTALLAFATGDISPEGYLASTLLVAGIVGPFSVVLTALAFLFAAGIFKMGRDVAFCRGMATAEFLIYLAMGIVSQAAGVLVGLVAAAPMLILSTVGMAANAALAGMTLYLWMLLLLKPQKNELMKAAELAAVFAVAMFLFENGALVLVGQLSGVPAQIALGPEMIPGVVGDLVFALPLIHFARGLRKPDAAAYLFAGLYASSAIITTAYVALGYKVTGTEGQFPMWLAVAPAALAAIWLLSRETKLEKP